MPVVKRLRGHRTADYATMAESVLLAVVIEAALALTSVARLVERLDRLQASPGWSVPRPSYRLERFAAAAYGLLPVRRTCLRESLLLYALLRRRGATPRLCLGVRKEGGALTAHAWVECAGLTTAADPASFLELRAGATEGEI